MKIKENHEALAVSVYILAMRKQIEEEVESRYSKRIEYLVGANNELMKELERYEGLTPEETKKTTLVDGTYYDIY